MPYFAQLPSCDPGSGWESCFGRTPWSSLKQSTSCSYSAQVARERVKLLDSPKWRVEIWMNTLMNTRIFQHEVGPLPQSLNHKLVHGMVVTCRHLSSLVAASRFEKTSLETVPATQPAFEYLQIHRWPRWLADRLIYCAQMCITDLVLWLFMQFICLDF